MSKVPLLTRIKNRQDVQSTTTHPHKEPTRCPKYHYSPAQRTDKMSKVPLLTRIPKYPTTHPHKEPTRCPKYPTEPVRVNNQYLPQCRFQSMEKVDLPSTSHRKSVPTCRGSWSSFPQRTSIAFSCAVMKGNKVRYFRGRVPKLESD